VTGRDNNGESEDTSVFTEGTIDCLPLANSAILIRLIKELTDRGFVAAPEASLRDAAERSSRVEDAVKLIRKELMPRILALAPVT